MPVVAYMLIMIIYPMLFSLYLMFTEWKVAAGQQSPIFIGLDNFIGMSRDSRLWEDLYNTLFILGIAVPVETAIGFGLALLLDREIKGKKIMTGLLMAPMIIAPILVGATWRMMMWRQYGVINYLLEWVPGYPYPWGYPWISSVELSKFAVIIVDTWHWMPFMLLISLAGLQSVPREPVEAARIDGASSLQVLRYVTFPHIRSLLLIGLVIRIADIFKIFDEILMLTQGGPGNSSETASMYIYRVGFKMMDMGYAAALTYLVLVVITGLTIVFVTLVQRELKR